MPLYMDFHIIPDVTVDKVKEAHVADKAIQEKYNVKYHQFWVNEEAGTVFCLMEGPDKESCEATHREAHGGIACKIEEVERGFYELFMGKNHDVDHGLVRHENGNIDLGYRFVLAVDIRCNTNVVSSLDYKRLKLPVEAKELVLNRIRRFYGKEIKMGVDDSIIGVFSESNNAVICAIGLNQELRERRSRSKDPAWDILFKMGISGAQPLTNEDGFFEQLVITGQRLCLAAGNGVILVAPLIAKLNNLQEVSGTDQSVRIASNSEEKFLNNLIEVVENNISNDHFSIDMLSRNIGVSRPQLYRKTIAIAGRSPNAFIRELRMQKALSLLRENEYNISEISLKVGIHNPSYFSKCFHDKYGVAPSKVMS